jgi:hypothetical protein
MTTVDVSTVARRPGALAELLRLYPKLLRWTPALAASLTVVCLLVWKQGALGSTEAGVWMLRGAGVIMAVGTVFLLDDPSANITNSSPTPVKVRSGARLLLVCMTVFVGCLPATILTAQRVSVRDEWPGVVLEIAAMIGVAAALSLTMQRWLGLSEPGQFAGIGVVGTLLCAQLVGARWPMLVGPGPQWEAAHLRWAVVLLLAGLAVGWQLRDPAATTWRAAINRHPRAR